MHPLQTRSQTHSVPSSSPETIQFLQRSLQTIRPMNCREIGTAIGRGSLHIANTLRSRDGHLTTWEVSYPSYTVARRHIDPRQHTNLTIYHAHPELITHNLTTPIDRCYIDCDAKSYHTIFSHLQGQLHDQAVVIFDDMLTASSKSPGLQNSLIQSGRHTVVHPSEDDDRLLIASKDHTTLDLLLPGTS